MQEMNLTLLEVLDVNFFERTGLTLLSWLSSSGMTFSDEPGVYIPGEFGIRIEDIVAVTDSGARRFNRSTHELMIVA